MNLTNPYTESTTILSDISETNKGLGTHIKAHQAAPRRGETEKSVIAKHAWDEPKHPLWEETSVLEEARSIDILRIKEAFCISLARREQLLNRDQGTAIQTVGKQS